MYIDEAKLYCYLPGGLLQLMFDDSSILDKLLEFLNVPGKSLAQLKRLPPQEKRDAIERQISNLRREKHSLWHDVDPPEILAASVWRSAGQKLIAQLFSHVKLEGMLLEPVAEWLHREKRLTPYKEIPMGTKRADLVGYAKGLLWGHTVVAVELKNDLKQFERCLDQMSTYGQYAEEVYLACTPYMAAQYLHRHADARGVRHWDPHVFNRKLEHLGFGLLLIMAHGANPVVLETIKPARRKPDDKKLKEVLAYIQG